MGYFKKNLVRSRKQTWIFFTPLQDYHRLWHSPSTCLTPQLYRKHPSYNSAPGLWSRRRISLLSITFCHCCAIPDCLGTPNFEGNWFFQVTNSAKSIQKIAYILTACSNDEFEALHVFLERTLLETSSPKLLITRFDSLKALTFTLYKIVCLQKHFFRPKYYLVAIDTLLPAYYLNWTNSPFPFPNDYDCNSVMNRSNTQVSIYMARPGTEPRANRQSFKVSKFFTLRL